MFSIRWHDDLAIRVKHLDDQRRRLLSLLRTISRERGNGEMEGVRTAVADLALGLQVHHATEEGILMRYGYDGLGTHCAAHRRLQAMLDALSSGTGTIPEPLWERMMLGWRDALVHHLRIEDGRGYGAFLRDVVQRGSGSRS